MKGHMLKTFEPGADALTYIRSQLRQGNQLAQYLLRYVPLEEGTVFVVLPDTASSQMVGNLETGGIARRSDTEPLLIESIQRYLQHPGRLALFEDKVASRGDPFLESSKATFVTCGPEIYHFLTASQAQDPKKIQRTIRLARSYMFIGILFTLPGGFSAFRTGGDIPTSLLETAAQNVDYLFIGAYDGEAELTWARSPRGAE
jgi:hypothetical protein